MSKILNQEELTKISAALDNKKESFYKPNPSLSIVVTKTNQKEITKNFAIVPNPDTGYDMCAVGTVDNVVYNDKYYDENNQIKVGVGIMVSITDDGKLDIYPNGGILDTSKFAKIGKGDVSILENEKVNRSIEDVKDILDENGILDIVESKTSSFTKIQSVDMIKVSDIKKHLISTGELQQGEEINIEATWGLQQDVNNKAWVTTTEGDMYKVEAGKDGNPEQYVPVVPQDGGNSSAPKI